MSAAAKTPLLTELAAKNAELKVAEQEPQKIIVLQNEATANAKRISDELVEAFASGDKALQEKLTRAKATAEAKAAEPWQERAAGAKRAAARLEAQRDAWVSDNYEGLMAEVAPRAIEVAQTINDRMAALEASVGEWVAVDELVWPIVRSSGRSRDVMPRIDSFQNAVRGFLRSCPAVEAPLPQSPVQRVARILATDDPDDRVREDARAEVIAAQHRAKKPINQEA